jgi:hypothetical protein
LQRLASAPDPAVVLAALDGSPPEIGGETLERTGPTIEQVYDADQPGPASAIEIAYQGTYHLDESVLEEPAKVDDQVAGLARWIASGLVRLADLDLPCLPADDPDSRA